jgi:hypothetical protein
MVRLIQLSLILLMTAPLYAVGGGPLINDPGTGGGGAGSLCTSSSCSRTCSDGSMSGIACLSRENAHCACDGRTKGYISQAAPYCTACTP